MLCVWAMLLCYIERASYGAKTTKPFRHRLSNKTMQNGVRNPLANEWMDKCLLWLFVFLVLSPWLICLLRNVMVNFLAKCDGFQRNLNSVLCEQMLVNSDSCFVWFGFFLLNSTMIKTEILYIELLCYWK